MMKMKRILSLVLALVMLVGMFTVAVSADENDNVPQNTTVAGNVTVVVTYHGSRINNAVVSVYSKGASVGSGLTDSNGTCKLTDISVSGDTISVAAGHETYTSGSAVIGRFTGSDDKAANVNGQVVRVSNGFDVYFVAELDSDYTTCIVNFISDGELIEDRFVKSGDHVTPPADPTKSGCTFQGWYYDDGTAFKATDTITKDTNIRAKWVPNSTPLTPAVPTTPDTICGTYNGAVKVSCAAGHHDTLSYDLRITDTNQVEMTDASTAVVKVSVGMQEDYLKQYSRDTGCTHTLGTKNIIAVALKKISVRNPFDSFFGLITGCPVNSEKWVVDEVAEINAQCSCDRNCSGCCGGWWHKHTVTYTDGVKNEVVFKDVTYTVKHGDKTPVPADPTRAGYKFAGWTPAVSAKTTSCVTYTATWTVAKTPDLTTDHVAYIKGYGKGLVKPEGEITRAEAITMLYRLMDSKSAKEFYTPYNNFTDVAKDAWYNDAVSTLANAGVLRCTSGKLNPNEAITRAEFFYMLTKFTDATYSGKCTFKDVPANHWAYDELALAQNLGWIKGYGGSMLYPDDTISRAEVTASLNRVLGRTTCTVKDTRNYVDNPVNAWYYKDIVEASIAH